jgi:hypothetical protein
MSVKISNLPSYDGNNNQIGYIPISINGVTYRVNPTQLLPSTRPYKVFTALLTQSGTGDPQSWSYEDGITIGATYQIANNTNLDVTNIGAPNNNVGTYFIATGTEPTRPGVGGAFIFDPGAPVAIILENTIGNLWFTYISSGHYELKSNGIFTDSKTLGFINSSQTDEDIIGMAGLKYIDINTFKLFSSSSFSDFNNEFINTPIEIRVYN